MLLPCMCQQQICSSNVTFILCLQITKDNNTVWLHKLSWHLGQISEKLEYTIFINSYNVAHAYIYGNSDDTESQNYLYG